MENQFVRARAHRSGRIQRVANLCERRVFAILEKTTARRGMRTLLKLRPADVLPIQGSGITDSLFEHALTAHFDFVITFDDKPVMALEFDGGGHLSHKSLESDRKKYALAKFFGLPFMRADTQYLRRIGNSTILEFVIDEILRRIQVDYERSLPMFSFEEELATPIVSEVFLPYDVKKVSFNPIDYLRALCSSKQSVLSEAAFSDLKTLSGTDDLHFETRLAKTKDDFYLASTLLRLDDDTAILGAGAFFNNPQIPLNAGFYATAFALIDGLELIRMFDEGKYEGVRFEHAAEFLRYFNEYASDQGSGRFLCLNPLCKELTDSWLKMTD